MIPEIYELFEAIKFLRKERDRYIKLLDGVQTFMELTMRHEQLLKACNTLINNALSEINDIAKERGNSYYDENNEIVWVPSVIKYKG